jgi:hypothetical protein
MNPNISRLWDDIVVNVRSQDDCMSQCLIARAKLPLTFVREVNATQMQVQIEDGIWHMA